MDSDSDDKPDWSAFTDDPEIAALLDFAPVVRRCRRSNGWTADNQRRFVVALVGTGTVALAAHTFGCTEAGAWKVRYSGGAEGFAAAWDGALALHLRRNPRPLPKGRPSRGEILAGSGRSWPAPALAAPAPAPPDEEARFDDFAERILIPYMMKLGLERSARLQGRIVEADFYVRQLTWLEVVLDLGDGGVAALNALKRGDRLARDIAATPMSVLLGEVRRAVWAKMGEPERPPPPALGRHDDEVATGEPSECEHWPERDGPPGGSPARRKEREGVAAEAQRAWEAKAKADAAAWRARLEGAAGPAAPADGATEDKPEADEAADPGPRIRPL